MSYRSRVMVQCDDCDDWLSLTEDFNATLFDSPIDAQFYANNRGWIAQYGYWGSISHKCPVCIKEVAVA